MSSQIIKADPYAYICDYVESIYPKIGRKTFEILALMPCSLIIPDLPYGSKTVRSNMNALFLAPAGSGKTSIAKIFASFTFSPLEFESITSAKLETEIAQCPMFSLIVGDFARMSRDPILIKVIEGLLGEEKSVSRKTMRKDIDLDVEGVALLCGVSTDLSKYILSGLIWRCIPILVGHNASEHAEIGSHIKGKIGVLESDGKEKVIRDYYRQLMINQSPSKEADKERELERVVSYSIPSSFREKIYEEWNKLTKRMVADVGLNFFRELQEAFRILISHAFLNCYNRKIQDGVLYPTEEDLAIALKLMRSSIKFKFRLIRSESFAKGIKDAKEFKKLMQSGKIPEQTKEILRSLMEVKGDKVGMR